MTAQVTMKSADILILGAGPAGLTAGLYASRAGKKTIVLAGRSASRLDIGYQIENYPGFPSIDSRELLAKFRAHAEQFGAEIYPGDAIDLNLEGDLKFVATKDAVLEAKAVIIASGKSLPKERMIPGEEEFLGSGVSYCATCDGPLYRGQPVAAVGNSAEAAQEVLHLADMAGRVHWVQGDSGAAKVPEADLAVLAAKGVHFLPRTKVKAILGGKRVEKVELFGGAGEETIDVKGCFIFREIPAGPLLARAGLALDHKQCLAVDSRLRTNLPGVFAAGDATCGGMQVVSAAGEGCLAALQALHYLRTKE
ncbi:MAG: FAD-dependent oxidoreductase [Candidatus Aminicenantes bacterium]|nr:FAD-dependent oxidoreductase [Candidatus Aminicenantes bacterium]